MNLEVSVAFYWKSPRGSGQFHVIFDSSTLVTTDLIIMNFAAIFKIID